MTTIRFCRQRPNHMCLGMVDPLRDLDECAGDCVRERGIAAPYKVEPPQETPAEIIAAEVGGARGSSLRVVQLQHKRESPMPADSPARLRELADAIERGEVDSMVLGCVRNGLYELHFPSSLNDTIVLIELLRARWVEKMRGD